MGADTVNWDSRGDPFVDVSDHARGDLRVVRDVEIVIVDVELSVGVGSTGSLEGSGDEALTEDVVEDGGAEATIFSEDLVDDVLSKG